MHLIPLVAENALFKTVGEIFHPLFVAIAAVLAWIYGIVPSYTAAIVLLTVAIMLVLTPLTIKSTRSMLAMQALQPEMQKLRAKYKGAENRQQLNEEMMKLYREHGVSPTGGCLPMFLQMPALIVLYDVIEGLANTVKKGTLLSTGKKCVPTAPNLVCATPRYVPHSSLIYQHLKASPGVMHSMGLNLAAKPLTHQSSWIGYVPYFAMIAIAVGLQYFQMAQMTRRNKRNSSQQQTPKQMQTMQRVMPLIFAYIYFLVPAGVVIYMIVSSAIRVLTQDMIFRFGLAGGAGERKVGGAGRGAQKPAEREVVDAASTAVEPPAGVPPPGGRMGAWLSRRASAQAQAPPPPTPSASNGRKRTASGNTKGRTAPPAPKAHPRSKAKRARKPR